MKIKKTNYLPPTIEVEAIEVENGIARSTGEPGQAGGGLDTGDDDLDW